MQVSLVLLLVNVLVYYWPIGVEFPPAGGQIEPQRAPDRPRPKFEGPLEMNSRLDEAERLFEDQFHAPESMAWNKERTAFYSAVEGGFIIRVEPTTERWFVVGRLNARNSVVDEARAKPFEWMLDNATSYAMRSEPAAHLFENQWVPFCELDVQLYGRRAEFEPALVKLSRCSRPLGVRLAPDQSYLYAVDPLSGLYRVELSADGRTASRTSRLVTFGRRAHLQPGSPVEAADEVVFADDLAVRWGAQRDQDTLYVSDCSRRWPLRHLVPLMIEYDHSGRLLELDLARRRMRELSLPLAKDTRRLSFPNGLELTDDGQALLISDLNNRRILKLQLSDLQLDHLLWVPGYSDNIRRAPAVAGQPASYWAACGCAVSDGSWELAEWGNEWPYLRRLLLKWLYLAGRLVAGLGRLANWTAARDLGLMLGAAWLRLDPYCRHGLVLEFDETGKVLRSLHADGFGSHFKLLSEAQQIPHANRPGSALYLASVFYSYLGRLELAD